MGHLTEKIGEKKKKKQTNKKPTYGLSSPMFSFFHFFTGEISPKIAIAIRISK
jgi:hypothetical protein